MSKKTNLPKMLRRSPRKQQVQQEDEHAMQTLNDGDEMEQSGSDYEDYGDNEYANGAFTRDESFHRSASPIGFRPSMFVLRVDHFLFTCLL
jgi:hypothetical protein